MRSGSAAGITGTGCISSDKTTARVASDIGACLRQRPECGPGGPLLCQFLFDVHDSEFVIREAALHALAEVRSDHAHDEVRPFPSRVLPRIVIQSLTTRLHTNILDIGYFCARSSNILMVQQVVAQLSR